MTLNKQLLSGVLYGFVAQPVKYPVATIQERIELYRHYLGLQGQVFCRLLNISQGSYSDIKNQKSLPSCPALAALAKVIEPPFTIHWILTGEIK